jgi:hypothetical protein
MIQAEPPAGLFALGLLGCFDDKSKTKPWQGIFPYALMNPAYPRLPLGIKLIRGPITESLCWKMIRPILIALTSL